jgi:hypothetical protein
MVVKQYYVVDENSDMYKKYFEWRQYRHDKIVARNEYLAKNIFETGTVWDNGSIRSLSKPKGEIPKGLRCKQGEYYPDKRTKLGKAFAEEFQSFDYGTPSEALDMLNFEIFLSGMAMWSASLWANDHDVLVASVPVKADGAYEPAEGMIEITSSEYKQILNHEEVCL